jgi:hypothetical protein
MLSPSNSNQKLAKAMQLRKIAKSKQKTGEYIPCLYLPHMSGSSKLMIYFHGNAEDIGLATELLNFMREMLKV